MHGLTLVLLAGGASTRMGTDKARIEYRGGALWEHQIDTLEQTAQRFEQSQLSGCGLSEAIPPCAEILISVRPGTESRFEMFRTIPDASPPRGPLGGLLAALDAAAFDRVLVLGVDMPEIGPEFLFSLVERSSSTCGFVPEAGGFYQGLAAVYPKGLRDLVERVLVGPDASFQNLVRQALVAGLLKTAPVSLSERSLFRNLNSPDDLSPADRPKG